MKQLTLLLLVLFTSLAQAVEFVTYYAHDQVGNPVAAIERNQGVIATRDTSAYSHEQSHTGNAAAFGDLGFTGQIDRSNNQLVYFNARYYMPELRRFVSPDAVTVVDGGYKHIDRYAYAYGNPLLYNDPSGNNPMRTRITLLAGGIGVVGTKWLGGSNSEALVNGGIAAAAAYAATGVGFDKTMLISLSAALSGEAYLHGTNYGAYDKENILMSTLSGFGAAKVTSKYISKFAGKSGAYDTYTSYRKRNGSGGIYGNQEFIGNMVGAISGGLGYYAYTKIRNTPSNPNYDMSVNIGSSFYDARYGSDSGYGSSYLYFDNYGNYSSGFDFGVGSGDY